MPRVPYASPSWLTPRAVASMSAALIGACAAIVLVQWAAFPSDGAVVVALITAAGAAVCAGDAGRRFAGLSPAPRWTPVVAGMCGGGLFAVAAPLWVRSTAGVVTPLHGAAFGTALGLAFVCGASPVRDPSTLDAGERALLRAAVSASLTGSLCTWCLRAASESAPDVERASAAWVAWVSTLDVVEAFMAVAGLAVAVAVGVRAYLRRRWLMGVYAATDEVWAAQARTQTQTRVLVRKDAGPPICDQPFRDAGRADPGVASLPDAAAFRAASKRSLVLCSLATLACGAAVLALVVRPSFDPTAPLACAPVWRGYALCWAQGRPERILAGIRRPSTDAPGEIARVDAAAFVEEVNGSPGCVRWPHGTVRCWASADDLRTFDRRERADADSDWLTRLVLSGDHEQRAIVTSVVAAGTTIYTLLNDGTVFSRVDVRGDDVRGPDPVAIRNGSTQFAEVAERLLRCSPSGDVDWAIMKYRPIHPPGAESTAPDGTVQIEGAGTTQCARLSNGRVWCRQGLGSYAEEGMVAGIDDALSIAVGLHDVCAVRRDGSVVCREIRAKGPAPARDDAVPRSVDHQACALRADGTVACWWLWLP
jgi:hypothetical protein